MIMTMVHEKFPTLYEPMVFDERDTDRIFTYKEALVGVRIVDTDGWELNGYRSKF